MIKKIVLICGVVCAVSANAQSSDFQGANLGINFNCAANEFGTKTDGSYDDSYGGSSINESIQTAYSFPLKEDALLSVGATYVLGHLKSGSDGFFGIELKAKNIYTIYIEPAYVIGKTALYGKLAYITMKEFFSVFADAQESVTIDGPSTFNFNGTA